MKSKEHEGTSQHTKKEKTARDRGRPHSGGVGEVDDVLRAWADARVTRCTGELRRAC